MRRPPLGQHFLRDVRFAERAVEAAALAKGDIVLEVGPGKGVLTRLLVPRCERVVAVEIDETLADGIARDLPQVELVRGDAVQVALPRFDACVSNLPYQISSPFLFRLLALDFRVAVLLVQKEFAERLVAKVGTGDYGRLSVNAQRRADIQIVARVPPGAFDPPPQVESALVRIVPRPPAFDVPANFDAVVERAFSQRRKKLRNTLGLRDSPFGDKRPEELTPEEFALVARALDPTPARREREGEGPDARRTRRRMPGGPVEERGPQPGAPRQMAPHPSRAAERGERSRAEVYEPAEDTQLLLEAMGDLALAGRRVLEVGPGSGVVIEAASRYGAEVVAVDVNPHAVEATRARIGGRVLRGDLASAVRGRFDVILFNAPYLPSSPEERVEGWMDHAFHGGEGGIETSVRFVRDLARVLAPDGKALLVVSSRADLPALEAEVARAGFHKEVVRSRRFFFEEVAVWMLSREP